jgi:DNA-binding transcriptional MerR regulator
VGSPAIGNEFGQLSVGKSSSGNEVADGMAAYRVEELAGLSGVSARNIRAYRERGLIDPPRRDGRTALYDDRHLTQLRAVDDLLRRGYTSAHIAEFFDCMRTGRDLADALGLRSAVFDTSAGDDPAADGWESTG